MRRQYERVAQVARRNAEIFGHRARVDARCTPARTLHVIAALAGTALKAWRMVMDEHAISNVKRVRAGAVVRNSCDDARWLVSQDARRLTPDVPWHDVAGANTRSHRAHQHFARQQLRNRTR